jgi:hypothetical protein
MLAASTEALADIRAAVAVRRRRKGAAMSVAVVAVASACEE